ncbi:hypothetical protein BCR44DRAFT_1294890 [Catenaria anguillulae PL171]|uniref:Uncharacterized protein n=1 Tax=Catenaria anguillulae PL171 TaxID=765915 RepID=A0A1Y2HVA1_9FUNG|nr:hypothetical protein BCR44DRAFT_1294890 [Catenaria anguillulae PL171]
MQPLVAEYAMAGPIEKQQARMRVGGTVHIIENAVFVTLTPGAVFGMMQYSYKTTGSPPVKQQPVYVLSELAASLPGIDGQAIPMFTKTSFSCRGVYTCKLIDPSIRDFRHPGFVTSPDFDAPPFAAARERAQLAQITRVNRATIEFYNKHIVQFKCPCSADAKPVLRHNVRIIFCHCLF